MRSQFGLVAVLLLFSAGTTLAQDLGPQETVAAFYKFSNARSPIFNKRHIELRKRWYAPELYREFLEELRDEKAELKANPTDKPFFGDGVPFWPLHEACEANGRYYQRYHTVGGARIKKGRASVDVRFRYPRACTSDTETIVFRVSLQRIGGKWLISDWTYPDGSTLMSDMRRHKH